MANTRARFGKAAELRVLGDLIDAGLDCYQTVVDDQGIDAVLRVETNGIQYFDVQVKSARSWQSIRGKVASLCHRPGAILILHNSTSGEILWLDANAIGDYFPATGSDFGDIFLSAATVSRLRSEGRDDLVNLKSALEGRPMPGRRPEN